MSMFFLYVIILIALNIFPLWNIDSWYANILITFAPSKQIIQYIASAFRTYQFWFLIRLWDISPRLKLFWVLIISLCFLTELN